MGWKILNIGEKVNKIKQKCLSLQASRRILRMSLYCLFFIPPIKIVSLSTLNEMFLAVFVYPKLPCEMSIGSNVVLVWGVVLGMEPACTLQSEAGSGALPLLPGSVSLLAFALLIDTLNSLK